MKYYKLGDKYYCDDKVMSQSTWYRDRRIYEKKLENSKKDKTTPRSNQNRTRQRSLSDELSIIKYKWLLDNMSDEILLMHKANIRKENKSIKTICNTKALQRDLKCSKEEFYRSKLIIKKEEIK